MNASFADTGYFVALQNRHDSLHACAVEAERTTEAIITTEFILIEVFNFFRRPEERAKFSELDASLRASRRVTIIPVSSDLYTRGLQLFTARPDKEWSLTDCISFEVMTDLELTDALSADHHFTQAGFRTILVL